MHGPCPVQERETHPAIPHTTKPTGGLSLSWLFLEDTVIHIPVKEEEKGAGDAVGRKLTIGDKTYQVRTDSVFASVVECVA